MGFKDESTVSSIPTTAVVLFIRVMIELMLLVGVGLPALERRGFLPETPYSYIRYRLLRREQ